MGTLLGDTLKLQHVKLLYLFTAPTYLVEEMSEVVFAGGKSVFFIPIEFLLENKDVAIQTLLQGLIQRQIQVTQTFQHVWLDLFKENQL